MAADPIFACVERWHQHINRELPGGLDSLLHPDVVFYSPVVFTPQRGIEITKMYLNAAGNTIGGEASGAKSDSDSDAPDSGTGFHYVTEILQGHNAMLEFESSMFDPERNRPTTVDGVDIITCDDDGMITEFKVMIRPLQALNLVHAQMKAMLEQMT